MYDLFDFGATHSFISRTLALIIRNSKDKVLILRSALSSGGVLMSEFCLKQVPITISSVKVQVDLIAVATWRLGRGRDKSV